MQNLKNIFMAVGTVVLTALALIFNPGKTGGVGYVQSPVVVVIVVLILIFTGAWIWPVMIIADFIGFLVAASVVVIPIAVIAFIIFLIRGGKATSSQTTSAKPASLIQAAYDGQVEAIKTFLANGENPNLADKDGRMALMCAATRGHVAAAQALLDGGANPNLINKYGRTPLMNADVAMVKVLLGGGANPNLVGEDGKTAMDIAQKRGQSEVVRALRSAGGKLSSELNATQKCPDCRADIPADAAVCMYCRCRIADAK